jgi:hypothetical protein
MRVIAGIAGGILVFMLVLGATTFITNHLVEDMPTRYQVLGYSCCFLIATAAGWSSFRAA